MKIIDFKKKGNLVRFYLGDDDCDDYHGDDWNDKPYECNAGTVYPEYVKGYHDIVFPFDWEVLEPCDGTYNSEWSKDDMKAGKVPCLIANDPDEGWHDTFDMHLGDKNVQKYYFNDKMEVGFEVYHLAQELPKYKRSD